MTGLSGNDKLFLGALVLGLLAAAVWLHGCKPSTAAPAAYGAELADCNRLARTCAESINCENVARKLRGRPLRDVDAGCD